MENKRRLIDATEAEKWAREHILDAKERYTIIDLLKECSSVDAVEVVRCKDCTWFNKHSCCTNPHCGKSWYGCPVPSNHYCSYGEPWSNIQQLPDESITNDEMRSYGYTWGGMIPMREKTAMEVIKFCTVYRLYADDTESMVLNESEISAHAAKGGIFGVQRVDWEAAGKY